MFIRYPIYDSFLEDKWYFKTEIPTGKTIILDIGLEDVQMFYSNGRTCKRFYPRPELVSFFRDIIHEKNLDRILVYGVENKGNYRIFGICFLSHAYEMEIRDFLSFEEVLELIKDDSILVKHDKFPITKKAILSLKELDKYVFFPLDKDSHPVKIS